MLGIEEIRETLGEDGKNLTDKRIEEIRNSLYELGEIIFDDWLENKKKQ